MAKKIKPVKSASPKGKKAAPKKAVTKPASPKGKKPIAKKVVKKAAVKKVDLKPSAKKVKKVPVKPVTSKVRKAAPKKVVAKKAITKKIIKKASIKKVVVKKSAAKKKSAPVLWPVQLPDATVENAANSNQQIMISDNGLHEAPVKTDDPVKTFDKNVFDKATSKGDPHSNRHFSSKPKNTIKPSGKKPLW